MTHLVVLVALAGLVNFSTTCCCGDSIFVELFRGGCDCHAVHNTNSHGTGHQNSHHACYKGADGAYLLDQQPGPDLPGHISSLGDVSEESGHLALFSMERLDARPAVAGPPPLVYLRTAQLLI